MAQIWLSYEKSTIIIPCSIGLDKLIMQGQHEFFVT